MTTANTAKGFAQQNRTILEKAGVETVLFEAVTPRRRGLLRRGAQAASRQGRRAGLRRLPEHRLQAGAADAPRPRQDPPLIGPDGVKDETFLKMTGKDSEGVMASYPKDTSTLPMYKAGPRRPRQAVRQRARLRLLQRLCRHPGPPQGHRSGRQHRHRQDAWPL